MQIAGRTMKRVTLAISLGLLSLSAIVLLTAPSRPRELSQAEFVGMFQSNLLAKITVYYPPKLGQIDGVPVMLHKVRGTFYETDATGQILNAQGITTESAFIARIHLTQELEQKLTMRTNVAFVSPNPIVQNVSGWFHHSNY